MLLLYTIIFLAATLILFTIPGHFFLDKTKINLNFWEKTLLGTIVGFVTFTLLTYISLIVSLPILPILAFATITLIHTPKFTSSKPTIKFKKSHIPLLLVFILGIVFQLAVIFPSGLLKDGDLVFYSAHGHDGPWHIALMNQINKGFPLQSPTFSREQLINYHFFSDVSPAIFQRFLGLSPLDLYFRLFPLIFSILLGSSAYYLGRHIGKSQASGIWATFFTFFAGSFGYVATLYMGRGLGGESIFWATQIMSSSGNPPQIISNFIMLTIIYLLLKRTKNNKPTFLVLLTLIGTLALFKVYAAVVLFISLGLLSTIDLFKHKKVQDVLLTTSSAVLAAALYLPNSRSSGSFLILEPWWYIRTMIVEPSRLNWLDHELRRQHYISVGKPKAWARVIQLELTGFLIFFFGNLGTRVVAFLKPKRFLKYPLILLISIFSIVLPLLLVQKGVASNTSQFLQYFILLFGILAGVATAQLLKRIKAQPIKVLIASTIVILSIPTQVALLKEFYTKPPLAKISSDELDALAFLSAVEEDSVILTPPYNQYLDLKDPTPNIWGWFDTSYVAAFSNQITYFDDYEQVDIMGYQWQQRKEMKENIFKANTIDEFKDLVEQTEANYLYFPKATSPAIDLDKTPFNKSFENESVEIWKI